MDTAVTATAIAPASSNVPAGLDAAARDALASALAAAMSPATRRAYRTAWQAFAAFAEAHGATPLPAAPEIVAVYLASRKAEGAGLATRCAWQPPRSPLRTISPARSTRARIGS